MCDIKTSVALGFHLVSLYEIKPSYAKTLNITTGLSYLLGIGSVAGIYRIVVHVKELQAQRTSSKPCPNLIKLAKVQIARGIFELSSCGILFLVPDIVMTVKRTLAAQRGFKKLSSGEKSQTIGKEILFQNPISQTLASFNNPRIKGQVNGLYIASNETNLSTTRQLLKEQPRPSDEKPTIHIGCATWHNFDIMSERKSNYGLIVDFNPENAIFIEKTIEILNESESRDLFKQRMIIYLNSLEGAKKDLFFHWDQHGSPTERVEGELLREGSWLQTEESFLYMKALALKGHLIAITEDITNFESFSRIRKFLDRNNLVIDTLYLSNICNFMKTASQKNAFVKSVEQLLANDTIFINCPKLRSLNTTDVTILQQKPILGSAVLNSAYDTSTLFEELIEMCN